MRDNPLKLSFSHRKTSLVLLAGMLVLGLTGCLKGVVTTQPQPAGYPIESTVTTTLDRTVVPVPVPAASPRLLPHETAQFAQYGYGRWQYAEGLKYVKRLELMPSGYSASTAKTAPLLRFFTMSDIHIHDEESPAQIIYYGYTGGNSSAYSPQILYTTQFLDATLQTINALHKQNPFDFGMPLGDAVNNAQYNELRWYLDVLDGKNVKPDSGIMDDPVSGPHNDYQDEFKAVGLDKTIPWYQTLGNHDYTWMGSYPVTDYLRPFFTGSNVLVMGDLFTEGIDSRTNYTGVIDGSTPNGVMIGGGPVADFTTPPTVPADPNRRPLSLKEWMSEFFKTSSNPVGHGFSQSNLDSGLACYSFEPKSDLPIKVIVFDDTQHAENYDFKEVGTVDIERYNWLVSELDRGQAEGKLMIIAAHIPLIFVDYDHHSPVPLEELISKLNTYPNLLMWVSGHVHRNTVTALKSPDDNHPELGFWLVETSSLRDFPQQFRTFDIVRNSDNTISILTTNVDPAVKDGSLAAISRSYAVAAKEIFPNFPKYLPPSGSYNAELVKQLSPEMQKKINNYGTLKAK
jgi:metallophosphoesterase (TIGR03768 family)